MQTWDDILATAVVGTEQREFKLVAREDELGSLLAQINSADREVSLLSAAAVVALYRNAGAAAPVDTQALPEACSEDDVSRGSRATGRHLAMMLNGEFDDVLPEFLEALAKAGRRVPEELLPALLDHGHLKPSQRRAIAAVLGRRGVWLAAQNPEWAYATPRDEKDVWETGSQEERLYLLGHLRSVDPAKALELLATTWSQESAKDRTYFLARLAIGLSSSDEAYLNQGLQDRSADVRRQARGLLAGLPNSEFSQRVKAVASQMLSFKKPLIGKARIEVTLPEDPVAWLKANGVEIDLPRIAPTKAFGPKGGSLQEIVSLTPITHWKELWQKSPAEIIRAAQESEWSESFPVAFGIAARRDGDPEWIEALLANATNDPEHPPPPELAANMAADSREVLILKALKSESNGLSDGDTLRLLMVHRNPWSDQLTRAVVASIRKRINQGKDKIADWQTKAAMKIFALRISPALSDEMSINWPAQSDSWSGWSRYVDAFQSVLAFRRDMHRAISEKEEES